MPATTRSNEGRTRPEGEHHHSGGGPVMLHASSTPATVGTDDLGLEEMQGTERCGVPEYSVSGAAMTMSPHAAEPGRGCGGRASRSRRRGHQDAHADIFYELDQAGDSPILSGAPTTRCRQRGPPGLLRSPAAPSDVDPSQEAWPPRTRGRDSHQGGHCAEANRQRGVIVGRQVGGEIWVRSPTPRGRSR